MRGVLAAIAILALCMLVQSSTLAQRGQVGETPDVAAAARAFQDGQKAQLARNFARAAELFELADQLAPTPEAVRSAMRNREAAGHPARAATIALEAKQRYPEDQETLTAANALLERVALALARLRVSCDVPCTLVVDGEALEVVPVMHAEAFVPSGPHRIEARFRAGRTAVEELELAPGEQRALELHAPLPRRAKRSPVTPNPVVRSTSQ